MAKNIVLAKKSSSSKNLYIEKKKLKNTKL